MRISLPLLLVSATCLMGAAQAQTPVAPPPARVEPGALLLENGEGRRVAAKLADELLASFVFRDQAELYAVMLRKNAAAGRYDEMTRDRLAKLLTDDLMAVHKDGHLHVEVVRDGQPGGGEGGVPSKFPPLIQSAKTIAPGIGYIRFSAFMGTEQEMAELNKWLTDNRDATTLIFDLRNHHGGGLEEQDAIFSLLYDRPTPLLKMAMAKTVYDKFGSPMGQAASLKFEPAGDKVVATHSVIPGADTPLRKATVYLLVSNKSASAAEHFALALKSTGRATLIGEATAGANHFGGPTELNDHFGVWMPVGRTYDLKTGRDWEGVGIAPDIAADPRQALVVALEKAGLDHADAVRLDAQEVPAEPVHSDKLKAR